VVEVGKQRAGGGAEREMASVGVEAVGAAEGGILGLIATMPIETVQKTQVVMQSRGAAEGGEGRVGEGARTIVERLVRHGGVGALYRGFPVLSTMVASEKFLYYLVCMHAYAASMPARRSLSPRATAMRRAGVHVREEEIA